jgi:hypothetical protein
VIDALLATDLSPRMEYTDDERNVAWTRQDRRFVLCLVRHPGYLPDHVSLHNLQSLELRSPAGL